MTVALAAAGAVLAAGPPVATAQQGLGGRVPGGPVGPLPKGGPNESRRPSSAATERSPVKDKRLRALTGTRKVAQPFRKCAGEAYEGAVRSSASALVNDEPVSVEAALLGGLTACLELSRQRPPGRLRMCQYIAEQFGPAVKAAEELADPFVTSAADVPLPWLIEEDAPRIPAWAVFLADESGGAAVLEAVGVRIPTIGC
jgi:hypothetical protein